MSSNTSWVDPFIGVDGYGNCLPGPYLPGSLVRIGPDTLYPQPTGGYRSDQPVVHFSHTHVSGTGGPGRYGNIGVMPFMGPLRIEIDASDRQDEHASVGFYGVRLTPSEIQVELTSTPRVGVHRYFFPTESSANILIDAGAVIQCGDARTPGAQAVSTGGFLETISDTEVVGRGDFKGGWGHGFPYSVYFYARFDHAFRKTILGSGGVHLAGTAVDGPDCRAALSFGKTHEVNIQVGISYVSIAKARSSVDREVGRASFDEIHQRARQIWEDSLGRIDVRGGSDDQRKLFYTLFTRLICMPTDLGINDENPFWESPARQYTDYYCLWDSVRNANSLISLFDPDLEVAMLNCLLDVADHTGWIPDAWIAGHSAMIQGGSSADILLSEAAMKGFTGIDYEKALKQMRKNNEVESPNPFLYGRHLKDYRDLGFVSTQVKNCVSRHLEYSYQDWCIAQLAKKLGHLDVAENYFKSSLKIWNLWREDIGFFAPRQPDGEWVNPFNPGKCRDDSWNDPYFYEGTSWQWSFSVHHDFPGLVQRLGGPDAFIQHLDEFFDAGHHYSKETMLHVPYLYIYAGRPDRTADRVRECMARYFKAERNGLIDNEDMGCQSAFYMASAMGVYPLMGQDLYWLTTPIFERTEITLGSTGQKLLIEAPGAGPGQPYIRSATLNGQPLDRAWIRHGEVSAGATLRFELSSTPTNWGTKCPPISSSFHA